MTPTPGTKIIEVSADGGYISKANGVTLVKLMGQLGVPDITYITDTTGRWTSSAPFCFRKLYASSASMVLTRPYVVFEKVVSERLHVQGPRGSN
jgi:hypothetical protein